MKVWALVIAYHPSVSAVVALAGTLLRDGVQVVVVDNTPAAERQPLPLPHGCEHVPLGRNAGIAHAQNVGIAFARTRGAEVIVFFDQDSRIEAGFVGALVDTLDPAQPGVVGPACYDTERHFEYPPYRFDRWGWARPVSARPGSGPQAVDLLISSGSAATSVTFDVAGTMDESFFIDYVDLEWCIRCRHRGVPIHVVPEVTMQHSIGQRSVDVGPLTAFLHSPSRSYYRVRNAFLLLRRRHVPRPYALKEIAAALVHHLLVLPYSPSWREHLRVYLLAIAHGVRGVTGPRA